MTHPHTAGRAESPRGREAKADRALEMLDAYNAGCSTREIAEDFGVTQRCVYIRLKDQGVVFDTSKRQAADFWAMPDDERRAAFIRRAANGAREQLKAIRQQSPLSTVFTGPGDYALTHGPVGRDGSY